MINLSTGAALQPSNLMRLNTALKSIIIDTSNNLRAHETIVHCHRWVIIYLIICITLGNHITCYCPYPIIMHEFTSSLCFKSCVPMWRQISCIRCNEGCKLQGMEGMEFSSQFYDQIIQWTLLGTKHIPTIQGYVWVDVCSFSRLVEYVIVSSLKSTIFWGDVHKKQHKC